VPVDSGDARRKHDDGENESKEIALCDVDKNTKTLEFRRRQMREKSMLKKSGGCVSLFAVRWTEEQKMSHTCSALT
jgi:hypothetical protein